MDSFKKRKIANVPKKSFLNISSDIISFFSCLLQVDLGLIKKNPMCRLGID